MNENSHFPYIHGFSEEEQNRLRKQAAFGEYTIFQNINFSSSEKVLEVGCGVGAQSEILLRRFPDIQLTGIDINDAQLSAAKKNLDKLKYFKGRYDLKKMDASNLEFESNSFDGAYLCWVLEHMPDPLRVLSEIRRVLKPGGRIYLTEVMNSTFFLDPYSPNVWKYWMAFNDFQFDNSGDPFIGAKLGNMLSSVGFRNVRTEVKVWHLDNRNPEKRKEMIEFWTDLLLSSADSLLEAEYITKDVVKLAREELKQVAKDPNAVYFDAFMQARAIVFNTETS